MRIGNRDFDVKKHTYVMGILNVTPDSFSDGGKWKDKDVALRHVEQMIAEGAAMIDVGGESTRPGYTQISAEEEIARIAPVIENIKTRFDIPISLDTYKAEVAEAGIVAGADLINDIWGLKYDMCHKDMQTQQGVIYGKTMAEVIAGTDVACCLMHNRREAVYTDFLQDVKADLAETLQLAEKAGIPREKIMLDPGVGFAKCYKENLEIINGMDVLQDLGCPLLLGCSRKSVIGLTLNLPVQERLEGTLATTVIAVMKGCSFVRVHDVKENVRAIRMAEAIKAANCQR